MESQRPNLNINSLSSIIMSYNSNIEDLIFNLNKLEGRSVAFAKGDLLFEAGQPPKNITVIQGGALRLDFQASWTPTNLEGVEFLQNRKIWGLQETILEEPFKWSGWASCRMDCKLIPNPVFLDHLKQNPMLRFKLLSLFAKEIQGLQPHFE